MKKLTAPSGYYVYALIDPGSGETFYVGKGKGRRAWQHEASFRAGRFDSNHAKNERIGEILATGNVVRVQILATFSDESDAIREESRLIATIPGLLNIASTGTPQSPIARLKVHRDTMRVAVEKIRPLSEWKENYPNRDEAIYHDVAASHRSLLNFLDAAIADEAQGVG